jgi:hypothetical protein
MKKSVMKRWVAALRSGKYKRGTKYLKQQTNGKVKHCCLGVLCEVAKVDWVERWDTERTCTYQDSDNGDYSGVPEYVQEFSGLKDCLGYFQDVSNRDRSISHMNDSGKYSFNKIADIIEKNWERL